MAKKAAKKVASKRSSKRGRSTLSYRIENEVDLELEYENGELLLLSILSHDPSEMELISEGGKYACVDAGVGVSLDEWILYGRTDYHGSGMPIEIIVPKDLINSMRIDNLG